MPLHWAACCGWALPVSYTHLTDYNLLSKPNWLGLQNYVKAFTDDQYFYPYFGNTFYFVVALVPIVLVLSLIHISVL